MTQVLQIFSAGSMVPISYHTTAANRTLALWLSSYSPLSRPWGMWPTSKFCVSRPNVLERVNIAKSDLSVLVISASLTVYCQYTQPLSWIFVVGFCLERCRYVAIFSAFGFFTATANMYFATLGVALASAFAESLPLPIDDNFTVPITAMGVGMLLLPYWAKIAAWILSNCPRDFNDFATIWSWWCEFENIEAGAYIECLWRAGFRWSPWQALLLVDPSFSWPMSKPHL